MSCKYSDFDGICQFFGDGIERTGYDEEGYCICEYDENHSDLCEDYEEL